MSDLHVDIPYDLINKINDKSGMALEKEQELGESLADIAKWWEEEEAPVLSRLLQSTIDWTNISPLEWVIKPDYDLAPWGYYQIFGTKPHWIGSPVFIVNVGWRYIGMHPGTEPNPFIDRADQNRQAESDAEIADFMDWLSDLEA
jgi:hypothetical protein